MKLWILRPVEELDDDNPWDPIYDKTFGFVIRAETEDQARSIAHSNGRDENANTVLDDPDSSVKKPWKDPEYSTCVELLVNGDVGVVLQG